MYTLKFHLQNLSSQLSILTSFFLENEVLLSDEILTLLKEVEIDLPIIFDLQCEVAKKVFMLSSIEIISEHPHYFTGKNPIECIRSYTSQESFTLLSLNFVNFFQQANNIAEAMLKSDQQLIEKLPPFYQNILTNSRKNRETGFIHHLQKITQESPYPKNFIDEYFRITNLITQSLQTEISLEFIHLTITQPVN